MTKMQQTLKKISFFSTRVQQLWRMFKLREFIKGLKHSRADWWVDDWQQKSSPQPHWMKYIFIFDISLPWKLCCCYPNPVYKIFINVDTTAANSIGGALSLVYAITDNRVPWSITCKFMLRRSIQRHEHLISHGAMLHQNLHSYYHYKIK